MTSSATLLYTSPSQETLGPLYLPVIIFYYGSFFLAYWQLFRHARHADPQTRKQVFYIALGTFITVANSAIFDIILPIFFQEYRFYSVGPVATIFMVGLISYAIFYHRLFDIRIVIQRSAIYAALLAIVVLFYLAAVSMVGFFLGSMVDDPDLIAAGITTVLGIFTVPILERHFKRVTNRFFFKDTYNYAAAMHELSEILNKSVDVGSVIDAVSEKLAAILRVHHISFVLNTNGTMAFPTVLSSVPAAERRSIWGTVEEDDKASGTLERVPIVLDEKNLGTIEIGGKLSGDQFSEEDRRFLKT